MYCLSRVKSSNERPIKTYPSYSYLVSATMGTKSTCYVVSGGAVPVVRNSVAKKKLEGAT